MMRAFAKCVMGLSLMSGASCGPRFRSTDSRDGLREMWATASTLLLSSHPCDASSPCRACCIETLCCFGRADRQEDAASAFQATACGKHDNPVASLLGRAPVHRWRRCRSASSHTFVSRRRAVLPPQVPDSPFHHGAAIAQLLFREDFRTSIIIRKAILPHVSTCDRARRTARSVGIEQCPCCHARCARRLAG